VIGDISSPWSGAARAPQLDGIKTLGTKTNCASPISVSCASDRCNFVLLGMFPNVRLKSRQRENGRIPSRRRHDETFDDGHPTTAPADPGAGPHPSDDNKEFP